jgi:hypothetical protein
MQEIRDSEIEQWVLHELQPRTEVGSKEQCVFCVGGVATLSGTVGNHSNKLAAQAAAERVSGVLKVVNKIRVNETMRLPLCVDTVKLIPATMSVSPSPARLQPSAS